jgi:hypothetical protein
MHRKRPASLSRVVEPHFTYSWLLVIFTQVAWFPTSYHPPTPLEMMDTMLISYRTRLAVPFSWSYSDIFTGLWKTSLRKSDFMFSIVCSVLVSPISYPLPAPRRYSLTTYNTPHRRWMFYLHRFLCLHHTSTPFTIYIHHLHLHLQLSPDPSPYYTPIVSYTPLPIPPPTTPTIPPPLPFGSRFLGKTPSVSGTSLTDLRTTFHLVTSSSMEEDLMWVG